MTIVQYNDNWSSCSYNFRKVIDGFLYNNAIGYVNNCGELRVRLSNDEILNVMEIKYV